MKAIVIDDDPLALRLLERQLSRLGHTEVRLFEHARDAVEHLEAEHASIDIVFCDLQMPEMDGVEVVRHLVRLGYQGALVLVSAEDQRILHTAQMLAQAHHINVLGTLTKPVSTDRLQTLLDHKARRPTGHDTARLVRFTAAALRQAIDEGQLVNHYQPQVSLSTGAFIGVEALVRWAHPQAGLVYPDEFIDIAEQNSLIDDLARTVLETALGDLRGWRTTGLLLQMAVNISMENLARLDFPEFLIETLARFAIPPEALMLEVTESRLMTDPRAALDILTRLRLKRISLSIDDFGTGHSSLKQLHDMPFDELKLDRSFVGEATHAQASRAIVQGALAMTSLLKIRSVAEGVETRTHWDLLRQLGCNSAQGYFIARPMPATQLRQWQSDWESRRQSLLGGAS